MPFSSICRVPPWLRDLTWKRKARSLSPVNEFHGHESRWPQAPLLCLILSLLSKSEGWTSTPVLTLELGKKVEDVTGHIKWEFPSMLQNQCPKYTTNTQKCGSQVEIPNPCLALMFKAFYKLDQGLPVFVGQICSPQQLHEADLLSATHRGQMTSPKSQLVGSQEKNPKACLLTSPFQYSMDDSPMNNKCFVAF